MPQWMTRRVRRSLRAQTREKTVFIRPTEVFVPGPSFFSWCQQFAKASQSFEYRES